MLTVKNGAPALEQAWTSRDLISPRAPIIAANLFALVAGVWIPVNIAVTHYDACDRLGISYGEQLALGREASTRAQATVLAASVARASG